MKPSARAVGDLQLEHNQVAAGDRLGDGMLDLDPAVDFEKEELLGVGVEHELDRAEVGVADRARDRDGGIEQPSAKLDPEPRRRALFDHLLKPALNAAIAVPERDDRPALVGRHLDLDVTGPRDEPLDVQPVVAERCRRFAAGHADDRLELVRRREPA